MGLSNKTTFQHLKSLELSYRLKEPILFESGSAYCPDKFKEDLRRDTF